MGRIRDTLRSGGLVAAGLLTLCGLTAGVTDSSAGAAPPPRARTDLDRGFPGERDRSVGPVTAPVAPAHANPAAARAAALTAHQHRHPAGMSVERSGGATAEACTSAAAILDPKVFGQWSTLGYQLPVRAVH